MILDQQRKIFHESWYRLVESRIALRASVRVHRQVYRGVLWYVLLLRKLSWLIRILLSKPFALVWLATIIVAGGYAEQTAEPVYLVRSELHDEKNPVLKMHGRSGKIRFDLGSSPLAMQGVRKARQALQKYYRL